MRSPLVRATACPECGRRVCSVLRRICAFLGGRVQTHCPYCGCPCDTPLSVYIVMLAVELAEEGEHGWCSSKSHAGGWRTTCRPQGPN